MKNASVAQHIQKLREEYGVSVVDLRLFGEWVFTQQVADNIYFVRLVQLHIFHTAV